MSETFDLLVPDQVTLSTASLPERLARLAAARGFPPFAPELRAFCSGLSGRLLSDAEARRHPELQVLGYWMRPAATTRLEASVRAGIPPHIQMMPRGLVFHVPPSNVDTLFIYSWLLSLLAGNRNIVRLSPRRSSQSEIILRLVADALADVPGLAATTMIVSYGHEVAVTAALSRACDMRVVWGGDRTIERLREVPLAPHAFEIAFADRFSFSALAAKPVLALTRKAHDQLAEQFFNDVYWFDQMGCASPHLIVWVGEAGDCMAAATPFYSRLAETATRKGYAPKAGTSAAKLAYAYGAAIDLPVTGVELFGSRLTVLNLSRLHDMREDVFGAGTLFAVSVPTLSEVAEFTVRKDQTLTHFGFSDAELIGLAHLLNGRGIDRIVPVGQALAFDRIWDGYDLISEFTRKIAVVPSPAHSSDPNA